MAASKKASIKSSRNLVINSSLAKMITKLFSKLSFLKRILKIIVPPYVRNSWQELKLVTWPTRRETWRMVGAVFSFTIILGGFVALLDKILDLIFKNTILK